MLEDNVTALGLAHGVADSNQQRAELVEGEICIVSACHLRRHFIRASVFEGNLIRVSSVPYESNLDCVANRAQQKPASLRPALDNKYQTGNGSPTSGEI